jgi:hypothetical protein
VNEPDQVLRRVTQAFDRLGVRYAIGGSVAASIHGIARSTRDLDVLVELSPAQAEALAADLRADFYVPLDTLRAAVARRSSCNVIHLSLQFKVDLFVAGGSPMDAEELERAVSIEPVAGEAWRVRVAAPEAMVVRKLDWFRKGGGLSDRQWMDVLGILKVQAGRLDEAWMRRMAGTLGVTTLLERALRLQGPPPR